MFRKLPKFMAMLLVIVLMVPTLAACSGSADTADGGGSDATVEEKAIVVGVSLPTQREERWVRDKEAMETYAEANGIELKVQLADADQAQQAQQVENLLTQGIDVLVLAPHDASASAELVKMATEEGVAVISYDRLVTGTDKLDYYLSFDNEKVGQLQGQFFVENVPSGDIMLFAGAPTDNNAHLFFKGAMSVIQPKIDEGFYTVVGGNEFQQVATDNWLPANAQNRATNILTANPDAEIVGVLAPNDGTAGGIIEAFKAANLEIPVTTGQDSEIAAVKRIAGGEQSMTIFKDTRALAEEAINMAVQIGAGEAIATNGNVDNGVIEVESVLLEPTVITMDNYQEQLIDSGYIDASEL